jgi:metal-dependent HD superfamily phosphatase/phosphodiesterase
MLSAIAVDSMLKIKGFKAGSLKQRIDEAATNHLITSEMAAWVHDVRLDANEQRHADENVSLPNDVDAKKSVSFALALAEFLFVLPARVERERKPQSQK